MSIHEPVQVSVIIVFLSLGFSGVFLSACAGDDPRDRRENTATQAQIVSGSSPSASTPPSFGDHEGGEASYKIVMLGDSLTAGFGLLQDQALPEQLGRVLAERGHTVNVINAGVSGDTTANGLARYDWSVGSTDGDMMIVALGANDYLQGVAPERVKANLSMIITRAKSDNMEVVIAGIETRGAELSPRDAAYGRIYQDVATEADVLLYPALLQGVRGNAEFLLPDALHPTGEGVEIMAMNLADFLDPVLPR